ncbi:MAG: S-methyl-5'-thioadenosine phosphorylase [Dehalococcoidia bacterium]
MSEAQVAVIGGSGFYEMAGLADRREVRVETPFGEPSDAILLGSLGKVGVAFLPRHGKGHRLLPSEVPARANIYALKTLGVERIISVNAVGSLREEIEPRHLVVPLQLIDRTVARADTFFGEGLVAHVSFADPFCPDLRHVLVEGRRRSGAPLHDGGTAVVIEGPSFSTRAESSLHRSWGADLVSMTMLPEAKLAREAGICYAALACVTDYDVWRESYADVTAQMILDNLLTTVESARRVVASAIGQLPSERNCACAHALDDALITQPDLVPPATLRKLASIIGDRVPVGKDGNGR